jgi:hypothetical protein
VAEPRGAFPHRVFVPDGRGIDQFLRVMWHAEARQFVLSIWQEELCVAAVRVDVHDTAELVQLLVNGLADAVQVEAPPTVERLPA